MEPERLFPDAATLEPVVRRAFADIDPTGKIGEECWNDYRRKLERWTGLRPRVERFFEEWPRHRSELGQMLAPPEALGGALEEAGAPARFGELDPPVVPETARWALRNCHLMRDRFTVADLLFFVGTWDDSFVERVLERARSAGGGL
jgi:glycerol-1-phosphate dehydrogenase [NAD(P)+]